MTAKEPYESLPVAVELHEVSILGDNCFRVILRLDDESYLHLQWPPDSNGFAQLLDFLTRLATERLVELGARGVVITGLTPIEDESEAE